MKDFDEDKLFGSLSDEFLASKILSDPTTTELAKEVATRILAVKARERWMSVAAPFGFDDVSETGAGPYVYEGDQIMSLDGVWYEAKPHEFGTAIGHYARVARDFR